MRVKSMEKEKKNIIKRTIKHRNTYSRTEKKHYVCFLERKTFRPFMLFLRKLKKRKSTTKNKSARKKDKNTTPHHFRCLLNHALTFLKIY